MAEPSRFFAERLKSIFHWWIQFEVEQHFVSGLNLEDKSVFELPSQREDAVFTLPV